MKQPRALLLGVSLASLASAALLQSTRGSTEGDVPQKGDRLELISGSQGHGSVTGNYWNMGGSSWWGVRGEREMCAQDDPITIYNFSVQLKAGSHHQIGVAHKECCKGVRTNVNNNPSAKFASLYSHTNGWNSYKGAASIVGTASQSTWFSGTWDGAGKTMLVSVNCTKRSFIVGIEKGDDFIGELSWPDSWDRVYAFMGSQTGNMQVYFHWRGVKAPPPPEGLCPKFQLGNLTNPWWRCDDHAPDAACNQSFTATQYGVFMRCGVQHGRRCGHTGLCSTTTTTTLHLSGPLPLQYFSQGHGAVYDNRWVQGGSSWWGVRGERRMCFDGDPVPSYKFKVRIDAGSHHQIGVAPKDCCYGVRTNTDSTSAKFASLYSRSSGWSKYRGAARPVGTPDSETWWSGTWDSGGKTMLVEVNCTKRTFTVGIEGVDDFLGEMTFPQWSEVYPFCGQESSNMDATFYWNF